MKKIVHAIERIIYGIGKTTIYFFMILGCCYLLFLVAIFVLPMPRILNYLDAKDMEASYNGYLVSQGVTLQQLSCPSISSRIGYCTFLLSPNELVKMLQILHLKLYPKDNLEQNFYDLQNHSSCTRMGWDKTALEDKDIVIYQVDTALYPTRPVYFPMLGPGHGYSFINLFYDTKSREACADIYHGQPEHIDVPKVHP